VDSDAARVVNQAHRSINNTFSTSMRRLQMIQNEQEQAMQALDEIDQMLVEPQLRDLDDIDTLLANNAARR